MTILKDLLRYTAKAQQDTGRLEQAIEMLMDIKKQADDLSTLDRITGYPGDLSLLGPIYRHVSEQGCREGGSRGSYEPPFGGQQK